MAISNRALDAALALAANPLLAANMRRQDLPPDVEALLRALSGDADALGALVAMARLSERKVLDALENYVQQIMLFNGAPAHRILGVPHGASRDEMRGHMRLLMIWLHPDRSGAEWRAAFSARVLSAWREAQQGSAAPRTAAASPRDAARRRSSHRAVSRRKSTQAWREIPVSRSRSWMRRRSLVVSLGLVSIIAATVAWAVGAYGQLAHAPRFFP